MDHLKQAKDLLGFIIRADLLSTEGRIALAQAHATVALVLAVTDFNDDTRDALSTIKGQFQAMLYTMQKGA